LFSCFSAAHLNSNIVNFCIISLLFLALGMGNGWVLGEALLRGRQVKVGLATAKQGGHGICVVFVIGRRLVFGRLTVMDLTASHRCFSSLL